MTSNDDTRSKLERALSDPSAVFDSPEDVVRAAELSDAEKLSVLERWEADARLLQIATEENMGDDGGDDGLLLQRVREAITGLGASNKASPSPTKSG
jgi:hypothetical protein